MEILYFQGDSGGPLVHGDRTVIGVLVNIHKDCNEKLAPAVYTRVTSYMPFIQDVMNHVERSDTRIATYTFKRRDLDNYWPKYYDINVVES